MSDRLKCLDLMGKLDAAIAVVGPMKGRRRLPMPMPGLRTCTMPSTNAQSARRFILRRVGQKR